ncbi:MAG: FAD-dependent oxidoreductase [Spirochaetaceae bacterium]|nr:MAG: FAD-dependent oxidoreductase [Spirochaetaceae bacterium]
MATLKKPENFIPLVLPPRKAQMAAHTDVIVVGGGPAGIGAAMGAAKAGSEVILAERYGFLGGNATAALVMPMMSYHTQKSPVNYQENHDVFLPADHGPGDPVIAGALLEFIERLIKAGGVIAPSFKTGYVVPFDPEIFKIIAVEMLDDNNVTMLFHSFASGIFNENNVRGVVLESKSGPLVITADVIVDCTGDGDIAAAAGAEFSIGREHDGLVQPMSLLFRMSGFKRKDFLEYIKKHPDQWRGVYGLWDLIKMAAEAGELNLPREDILFFDTLHDDEVSVNSTRIIKVLGTDVWDLSFAETAGRRQVKQIAAFLKKYVPGFGDSYVIQTGTTVGVRETRRITGDYILTAEDIGMARKFDDAIAMSTYPVDIHNPEGKGTILKKLPWGESYDIPLRCLLPKNVEDILVAGRCISGDHIAHSSYRVMPTSMATGQAAGVSAALASKNRIRPRYLDIKDVQKELIRQGAYLHK